jgi:hypothetical protein
MGRPRSPASRDNRVVTKLDLQTVRELDETCRREHVSRNRLLEALVRGYLGAPVFWIIYKDHVYSENPASLKDCSPSVRELVGFPVEEASDHYKIVSERPYRKLPNERDPAGYKVYVILKNAIVELRRLSVS